MVKSWIERSEKYKQKYTGKCMRSTQDIYLAKILFRELASVQRGFVLVKYESNTLMAIYLLPNTTWPYQILSEVYVFFKLPKLKISL